MSHTPGPWIVFVDRSSDAAIFSILPAGRAGEIAGNIENGDDADLIAATPKLLATLRAACGYLLNAKIDLETGAPKKTALRTIEGGVALVQAALAQFETINGGQEDKP